MLIGHCSDLHGQLNLLLEAKQEPDIWINSGDFLPNKSRGNLKIEVPYQTQWVLDRVEVFKSIFKDRKLLWCPGNHDFVDLEELLQDHIDIVDVTKKPVIVNNMIFYGAREINYIAGEWAGEIYDFQPVIERFLNINPDILITHSPPAGILDSERESKYSPRYGVQKYLDYFSYHPNKVKHWFFGHVHRDWMQPTRMIINETMFYNSSCRLRFYDI